MRRLPTVPVVLAGSAAFLDLYATQPLLPLLARTFGASALGVSLTVTAPTVAVAISAPAIGRIADHFGLQRVIVTSAFALAAATALAATSTSLAQLIVWRFVQGLATPGIFASTVAYVHEVWPSSHAGRATAAYMTGTVLGGFTGRAVAGLVAADLNWHYSFVALAIMNFTVAIVLALWLPPEHSGSAALQGCHRGAGRPKGLRYEKQQGPGGFTGARGFSRATRHLFQNPRLVATFAIGFCVLFTQVAMFTYVTFYLAAPPFRLSTVALGWLFTTYLVGAVATPFGGRWIDAYGHRAGMGSAMGIGAVGALLTLLPSLPLIVAGLALCATGVFIAQATTSSHIGAVTTRDRALAVGLYSTFYYVGGSVGSALPSIVWRAGGWPACVALVVAVQTIGATIAFTQWSPATRIGTDIVPESGV
jgi:MFS transporter, YNFM family, putative membrane transport protein